MTDSRASISSATAAPAIQAHGLVKRYGGKPVVDDVSLRVSEGEFFGLFGPNGAGKSTTIRMLCGLVRPTSGSVSVAGIDVASDPIAVKRHIGVVSDDIALYERLTAREFLVFAGRMHGLSAAVAQQRADDLLQLVDLSCGAESALIADYSSGMRRKTAIAAALIHRPRVLFLDEPFNAVDTLTVRALCDVFRYLVRERGIAILFTSHALDSAEGLCDRAAILSRGRVIAEGTVKDLTAAATGVPEAAADHAGPISRLEAAFVRLLGADAAPRVTPTWL